MTTITDKRQQQPDTLTFTYRRGTSGVDDTFDIVFLPTDRVVASLPYWDEEAATQAEARRLTDALNALQSRGGSFCMPALVEAAETINAGSEEIIVHDSVTRPDFPARDGS